jgi:PIN domain nuclease of toxin-antitoxin system
VTTYAGLKKYDHGMVDRLLLDTHVWLHFVNGDPIAKRALRAIQQAEDGALLHVSAISMWEIAMLASAKRVRLGLPTEKWLDVTLARLRATVVPLSARTATESAAVAMHGDPADRLIVATAMVEDMRLATRDEQILEFAAKTKRVRVLEA